MSSRFEFKSGKGSAGNASRWKVCYDKQEDRYTAEVTFGGAGGASYRLYEIDREAYEKTGTFEDDDYKSERLIRENGRKLYASVVDRNIPGCDEVYDRAYRDICPWAEIVSFVGK